MLVFFVYNISLYLRQTGKSSRYSYMNIGKELRMLTRHSSLSTCFASCALNISDWRISSLLSGNVWFPLQRQLAFLTFMFTKWSQLFRAFSSRNFFFSSDSLALGEYEWLIMGEFTCNALEATAIVACYSVVHIIFVRQCFGISQRFYHRIIDI